MKICSCKENNLCECLEATPLSRQQLEREAESARRFEASKSASTARQQQYAEQLQRQEAARQEQDFAEREARLAESDADLVEQFNEGSREMFAKPMPTDAEIEEEVAVNGALFAEGVFAESDVGGTNEAFNDFFQSNNVPVVDIATGRIFT